MPSTVPQGEELSAMSHTVIVEFTCPEGVGEAFLPGLIDLLVDTKAL